MPDLYHTDFYRWTTQQAELLRAGRLDAADIAHIAEELDALGRSEKRELVSRLTVLLTHLLKWQHQPNRRSKSWQLSIENAREAIADHLADNPSVTVQLDAAITTSYRKARREAAVETGLELGLCPAACPWEYREIMAADLWPM
jgi:uncharacterized protein DUF29